MMKGLEMDVDEVLHAVDRTLTDLLPDKHQYEPDMQLYLDYSLPPHPVLPSMEEALISKHYEYADLADGIVQERGFSDGTGVLEQQSLQGHDRQLAVLTEQCVEASVFSDRDSHSATDVWHRAVPELSDNADDSQASGDVSAAPEHLHLAHEAHDEESRGRPAATPEITPRASVNERISQASGVAGGISHPALQDGTGADSESLLDRKEGRAPEDRASEAELLQTQSAVIEEGRQASLAPDTKLVAGRDWAAPYALLRCLIQIEECTSAVTDGKPWISP